MTAKTSESEPPSNTPDSEPEQLSYEGYRVPIFVVVLWLLFFVWGVYYLLRWIPQSWQEWFSGGS